MVFYILIYCMHSVKGEITGYKVILQYYVKIVEVFKDHVEVIFNVVFGLLKEGKDIKIKSEIDKRALIERYNEIFYIKISF